MSYKINLQQIADELEFDLEDVEMIMDSFLENSMTNLQEMRSAIESNDFEKIRLCSHSIKGSSSNLLLHDIAKITKEIEENSREKKDIDYLENYAKLKSLIEGIR